MVGGRHPRWWGGCRVRREKRTASIAPEGFGVMVRHARLFSQLRQQVPRDVFDHLLHKHAAEAKGFTCWTQFVAMLFCHLGRADSLREICSGLACCVGKSVHVGVRAPRRSTLSYANAPRPAAFFQDLFWYLAERLREDLGMEEGLAAGEVVVPHAELPGAAQLLVHRVGRHHRVRLVLRAAGDEAVAAGDVGAQQGGVRAVAHAPEAGTAPAAFRTPPATPGQKAR